MQNEQPEQTVRSEQAEVHEPLLPPETPKTSAVITVKSTRKLPKQRHFLAAFFISFFWGTFGIDRMYLGKWGTGILKLVTVGGFFIWTIIDLGMIMSGSMRDAWGRPMLQVDEYKKFAARTVFYFALVIAILVIINGALLLATVVEFMNAFQNGELNLDGLKGIPGLESLQGMYGLSPEERAELGL